MAIFQTELSGRSVMKPAGGLAKTITTKAAAQEVPGIVTVTGEGWKDAISGAVTGFITGGIGGAVTGAVTGFAQDQGTVGPSGSPCPPGFTSTSAGCIPVTLFGQQVPGDPTPIGTTPAEFSVGGGGLRSPSRVPSSRLQCPKDASGSRGVVWEQPITGELVCLPRKMSGTKLGLVRKNLPRKRAVISAFDAKQMAKFGAGGSKAEAAKKHAQAAGFSVESKAASAGRRAKAAAAKADAIPHHHHHNGHIDP